MKMDKWFEKNNKEKKYYFAFTRPTQIKYIDLTQSDEVVWIGAIAYFDEIICGCCGCVIQIPDYLNTWEELKYNEIYDGIEEPIEIYSNWRDIENYIKD